MIAKQELVEGKSKFAFYDLDLSDEEYLDLNASADPSLLFQDREVFFESTPSRFIIRSASISGATVSGSFVYRRISSGRSS